MWWRVRDGVILINCYEAEPAVATFIPKESGSVSYCVLLPVQRNAQVLGKDLAGTTIRNNVEVNHLSFLQFR